MVTRKLGDIVLYDRFGSKWPDVSPSTIPDDFGIGIILNLQHDMLDDDDNTFATVIKDDGTLGTFSLSYLVSSDYFC